MTHRLARRIGSFLVSPILLSPILAGLSYLTGCGNGIKAAPAGTGTSTPTSGSSTTGGSSATGGGSTTGGGPTTGSGSTTGGSSSTGSGGSTTGGSGSSTGGDGSFSYSGGGSIPLLPFLSSTYYSLIQTGVPTISVGAYPVTNGGASSPAIVNLPSTLTVDVMAADSSGLLYVGGRVLGNVQQCEVLVYSPSSATPNVAARTVILEPGTLTALAVDNTGQIYAGLKSGTQASVRVYAATASGSATAATVLNPAKFQSIFDIALDGTGRIFVSGYDGVAGFIDTYAAGASGGATPTATLLPPAGVTFGGIAVDASGNLWAVEQQSVVQFTAGATSMATPLNSITLPGPSGFINQSYGNNQLRIDSAGYLYVPVASTLTTGGVTGGGTSATYMYWPAQTGSATPLYVLPMSGIALSPTLQPIALPIAVH